MTGSAGTNIRWTRTASREMVARILKDLSTGKYITIEGKRLIINEKLPTAY
jgi:hypothetical protein